MSCCVDSPLSGAFVFCSHQWAGRLEAILVNRLLYLGPRHFWSQGSEAPAACSGFHSQKDEDIWFTRTLEVRIWIEYSLSTSGSAFHNTGLMTENNLKEQDTIRPQHVFHHQCNLSLHCWSHAMIPVFHGKLNKKWAVSQASPGSQGVTLMEEPLTLA